MHRIGRGIVLAGMAGLAAHGLGAVYVGVRNSLAEMRLAEQPRRTIKPATICYQERPAIINDAAWNAIGDCPLPRRVRLRQKGEMRLSDSGRWNSFSATQVIGIEEPGFIWIARLKVAPFVTILISDAFVGGAGWLDARLFGSIPIARSAGHAVDRGELMRYIAELPWAPHALIYNRSLGFRELSPDVVEVSSPGNGGLARVRLLLKGTDIVRIEADERPRIEPGGIVPRPWSGEFSDWRQFGGVRVPTRAEVRWLLPGGAFDCWRGEVFDWQPL